MAETLKNIDTEKVQDLASRVQDKVTDVAQDVSNRFEQNRPLMYAGIGLLTVAAGFGIYALFRQFGWFGIGGESYDLGMQGSQGYQSTDEYRRSGAV